MENTILGRFLASEGLSQIAPTIIVHGVLPTNTDVENQTSFQIAYRALLKYSLPNLLALSLSPTPISDTTTLSWTTNTTY